VGMSSRQIRAMMHSLIQAFYYFPIRSVVPEVAAKLDSANPSVVPEMRSFEPLNITFTDIFAIGKVGLHILFITQISTVSSVLLFKPPFKICLPPSHVVNIVPSFLWFFRWPGLSRLFHLMYTDFLLLP
jgi:hypothetical protein